MRRHHEERGVAALEFLLAAPLLFAAVLGVLQVALVAKAQSSVEDAARAAAHASRNGANPETAASRAAGSGVTELRVSRSGGANDWTATAIVKTVFPGAHVEVTKSVALP